MVLHLMANNLHKWADPALHSEALVTPTHVTSCTSKAAANAQV